jgi:hypothetical protein
MGPLVPFIVSEELSLVIAFFLGIGFGFTLEQAGFSSTKNLSDYFMVTILQFCGCFLPPVLLRWRAFF